MLPELLKIPFIDVALPTYGLLLALAFISGLWITATLAARDGLPKNRVYDLGLYVLASGLIGAKLLMVAVEWREFRGDWGRLLSLDVLRSGGVFFGGFLAALAVSVLLVRRWELPWRKTADVFAPGVAFGHFIGRLGCFSAGCCWGVPTQSWIGVTFTQRASEVTGVPSHEPLVPTQLIEAAAVLSIFGLLLLVRRRRTFDGQVMLAYLILYSAVRFTIEFWRADERGEWLGLSTSQLISIAMFPLALFFFYYYWRRSRTGGESAHDSAQELPAQAT